MPLTRKAGPPPGRCRMNDALEEAANHLEMFRAIMDEILPIGWKVHAVGFCQLGTENGILAKMVEETDQTDAHGMLATIVQILAGKGGGDAVH